MLGIIKYITFAKSSKDFTFTNLKIRLICINIKASIERFSVKSGTLNRGFFYDYTLATTIGTDKCSYVSRELFTILLWYFFLSFIFLFSFYPFSFLFLFSFLLSYKLMSKTQGLTNTYNTTIIC